MVEVYDKYNEKICESDNIEDAKSDVMRYIYTHYKYGAFPKQECIRKLNDNNFDYFIEVGYHVNYNQANPREFNFLFNIAEKFDCFSLTEKQVKFLNIT